MSFSISYSVAAFETCTVGVDSDLTIFYLNKKAELGISGMEIGSEYK